ncbi:MAG: hypothetical protein A3D44_04295 [Candidatus Staskawiczbacteria bacterium RIFCSPHIGHO2_02_FULL_42_22]|uniref:Uncharacterized protein n=1 Tax=Candidatus Staskawiczbacteria bacterium RIFCSPHIGHO2_02_FULL_42_22 TaxID=1802207 RepID=A0A1G2I228_9BACT|nr:MAG: hypothetical protein A3D44_04295 [Candidatus Staskawiczbacteria bacterium RIFCSPHIGHO2_02_FULL_42_22]
MPESNESAGNKFQEAMEHENKVNRGNAMQILKLLLDNWAMVVSVVQVPEPVDAQKSHCQSGLAYLEKYSEIYPTLNIEKQKEITDVAENIIASFSHIFEFLKRYQDAENRGKNN